MSRGERFSPRLAGVVDKCLSTKPEDRYQTVAELRAALTAAGEDAPSFFNRLVRTRKHTRPLTMKPCLPAPRSPGPPLPRPLGKRG